MSDALDDLLAARRILRTTDLHRAGLDGRRIAAAVDAGRIERATFGAAGTVPGLYVAPDACMDDDLDACLALMMTGGVLCGQYVAHRQGLATCMPDDISVLVFHTRTPVPRAGLSLVRTRRADALDLGVEPRMTGLGVTVLETTPARTVVDLFRGAGGLEDDRSFAVEALVGYLDAGGTPAEVSALAGKFSKTLPGIIELACAVGERRMSPSM